MTDNIIHLKARGYIEVEQCDLDVEEELREAYAINGPVCSIIAEFREEVVQAALAKARGDAFDKGHAAGFREGARAAQGTEAQRATTVEQGVVHDGPVRDSECAHTSQSSGGGK